MNLVLIVYLISTCGTSHNNVDQKYIEQYQVISPILAKTIEATIDSCQSRIGCDIIEHLFINVDTSPEISLQLESLRKPLHKLSSIYNNDSSQVICFYIGKTLCFVDKKALYLSGIFHDFIKVDRIDLSNQSFEYNCLDIEVNGEIYNTLITFRYSINNGEVVLENHSIFIDAGEVDISGALKKRGISGE